MASHFSLHAQRKVTKRKGTPISLPFGSPPHSPLPTGRPDSPSGLDMTKSDIPVGFSLTKANTSANFMGRDRSPLSSPKTASLVGSIDQGRSIESCRARMRVKTTRWQWRWLRVCEARAPGACFLGYLFCTNKKGNSLQQERNQCLVTRDNKQLWQHD